MIKLLINKNDVDMLIRSYSDWNNSFCIKDIYNESENKQKYIFYIDAYECKMDVYFLNDSCKFVPTGKNIEKCNLLIDYLKSKCVNADVKHKQYSISIQRNAIEEVINEIKNEEYGFVTMTNKDQYNIQGYDGDIVRVNVYDKKTVIQAKPLRIFGVLMNLLGPSINMDFSEFNVHKDIHGELLCEKIRNKIGDCFDCLDKSLQDTLCSSFELITQYENNASKLSDYSGILLGAFKALEGYLRKILIEKYGYSFHSTKFEMFYKQNGKSKIDKDKNIRDEEKEKLNIIYKILSDKRNYYLHGSGTQTRIIKNFADAYEIMDEILCSFKESYEIIFKENINDYAM